MSFRFRYGIAEIMNLLGLQYPRNGKTNVYLPCPFCGTKDNFNVSFSKNKWHCFKCERDKDIKNGGGMYGLYALMRELPDTKAAKDEIEQRLFGTPEAQKQYSVKERYVVRDNSAAYRPAGIEKRDAVYRALLQGLQLSDIHRIKLYERGLDDEAIVSGGYRSVPFAGYTIIAERLQHRGLDLKGVPGFYTENGVWRMVATNSGILIPFFDYNGRIQGFQVRFDNPKDKKYRYRWLSSNTTEYHEYPNGAKANAWIHFAGVGKSLKPTERVGLTEGPIKANVIYALSGMPMIAVAGVKNLQYLKGALKIIKNAGVKEICNLFDMDRLQNERVMKAVQAADAMIRKSGLTVRNFRWDPKYKGFDDYLYARSLLGKTIENKGIERCAAL